MNEPGFSALKAAAIVAACLLATACGFKPIYATPADGSTPVFRQVALRSVAAPETIQSVVSEAIQDRLVVEAGSSAKYDLYVSAAERAERLAVQIDATVTRYNYRLTARYTAIDSTTGEKIRGSARAVTSYNIVTSQYSTLYAERTAVEKAAKLLAEDIERDLLVRLAGIESDGPVIEVEDDDDYVTPLDTSRDFLTGRTNREPLAAPTIDEEDNGQ